MILFLSENDPQTLLGQRLLQPTSRIAKIFPKKLASNDAEDPLCSLFLYFLSFFFFSFSDVYVYVVCILKTSLFLTVVHPRSLCLWKDEWPR